MPATLSSRLFNIGDPRAAQISDIGTTIGKASELGRVTRGIDRKRRRREIRKRIAACEAAEQTVAQLRGAIAQWNMELAEATDRHQELAENVQTALQSDIAVEKRLELRQELQRLNSKLQLACDMLNSKIATAEDEAQALFTEVCAKPTLEGALQAMGEPSRLRELHVAKTTSKWANLRLHEAREKLGEQKHWLNFYSSSPNDEVPLRVGLRHWDRETPQPRMSNEDLEEVREALELADLEFATASQIANDARKLIDDLHAQIAVE